MTNASEPTDPTPPVEEPPSREPARKDPPPGDPPVIVPPPHEPPQREPDPEQPGDPPPPKIIPPGTPYLEQARRERASLESSCRIGSWRDSATLLVRGLRKQQACSASFHSIGAPAYG